MATPYLYVVVPCYNEAGRLNRDAFRNFAAQSDSVHMVFVDDGSSDATASVLDELKRGLEHRITVVSYPKNRGKAEAVRTGILYALGEPTCKVIGYWDADLATPLASICRLAQVLEDQPQVNLVFGSRVKLCGRHIHRKAVRHYLGRVFATAVSTMLALAIYDTQCGAKLFRATAEMQRVFAQPFLSRWIFDVEILARIIAETDVKHLEGQLYEFPLEEWRDISGSKLRPKDIFYAMFDILRIRRRYL